MHMHYYKASQTRQFKLPFCPLEHTLKQPHLLLIADQQQLPSANQNSKHCYLVKSLTMNKHLTTHYAHLKTKD